MLELDGEEQVEAGSCAAERREVADAREVAGVRERRRQRDEQHEARGAELREGRRVRVPAAERAVDDEPGVCVTQHGFHRIDNKFAAPSSPATAV